MHRLRTIIQSAALATWDCIPYILWNLAWCHALDRGWITAQLFFTLILTPFCYMVVRGLYYQLGYVLCLRCEAAYLAGDRARFNRTVKWLKRFWPRVK